MERVKVRDKEFTISISEEKIRERVRAVAAAISRDFEGRKPIFLAVLNGSFVFAADLLRGVSIPCEVAFVRLSSYSGTSSTGNVRQLLGLDVSLKERPVVVVEDIVDSGLTMQELLNILRKQEPEEIRIASLLVKPDNLQVPLSIDYRCFDIPSDFIVGYGLDYDGEGRNLPCIYTVVDD